MKTLFLILLFPLLVFCQYHQDTMNVSITIPTDQLVIDQIETLECFFQESAIAGNISLYASMSIEEARTLGGVLDTTYQGSLNYFTYNVTANGNYFNFAVFGLDVNGNEVIHQIGNTVYHLQSGTCGIQRLPLMQDIIHENILIQVQVDFQ